MKKLLFILTGVVVIVTITFLFGKWDQLKYYFRLDNTELSVNLVNHPANHELKIGESVNYIYEIQNSGSKELIIENVLTECDCLVSNIEAKTIKSGESTKISIQFIPEKQGEFEKNALIEANTAPPLTVLTIEGVVE